MFAARYLAPLLATVSIAGATAADEYDYVIVGSGPGGGSLASNLATSGYSVFLIEAGGNEVDSVLQSLPLRAATAAESAGHGWQFFVEHYANETQARRDPKYTYIQPDGSYYVGLDPPEGAVPAGLYYPRGSTLGGSAQVNAMNFIWAPDYEWDYIAELTGDESWGHEYMRQHLMALENATYVPVGTPGHGFEGFLQSSQVNATTGLRSPNVAHFVEEMFRIAEGIDVQGVEQMAELLHRDINGIESDRWEGPGTLVTTPVAISPTTQSRSGIGAYLNEVVEAGHPLTISLHSLATKILFKNSGRGKKPRAIGVEYMVGEGLYSADRRYDPSQTGEIRSVRAKKEVIVSGGTFNTPQILMLSGIGPPEELEAFSIPVVVDLPAVGHNLMDNYEAPLQIRAAEPWIVPQPSPCTGTFDDNDPCFVEWRENATGPYITTQNSDGYGGAWRSQQSWDEDCDILLLSGAGAGGGPAGFFPGYSNRSLVPNEWLHALVKMQTSNTAGTVKLNSTDPREAPLINFNYFAESGDRDLAALEEAMEMVLSAFDATGIPYEVLYNNREDLRQGILDSTFSHHASSTCRMGPADDRGYCVDSRFRVQGVDRLRVVDASVFPRSPGGMPNGPTYTISRKAYEVILEDNGKKN